MCCVLRAGLSGRGIDWLSFPVILPYISIRIAALLVGSHNPSCVRISCCSRIAIDDTVATCSGFCCLPRTYWYSSSSRPNHYLSIRIGLRHGCSSRCRRRGSGPGRRQTCRCRQFSGLTCWRCPHRRFGCEYPLPHLNCHSRQFSAGRIMVSPSLPHRGVSLYGTKRRVIHDSWV